MTLGFFASAGVNSLSTSWLAKRAKNNKKAGSPPESQLIYHSVALDTLPDRRPAHTYSIRRRRRRR